MHQNWRSPTALRIASAIVMTLAAMASPAVGQSAPAGAADRLHVLVTRDGHRLEARGPWRVEGARIIYTDERGVLSSVRLSAVDLEASERASAVAVAPATVPEPTPSRPPALVLQDGDVARFQGAGTAGQTALASGQATAATSPAPVVTVADAPGASTASAAPADPAAPVAETRSPVAVVSFRDLGSYDEGAQLFGTLRNDSDTTANKVTLQVRVVDEAGRPLATSPVPLSTDQIAAGATLNFRIALPEVRAYGKIEFEITSRN